LVQQRCFFSVCFILTCLSGIPGVSAQPLNAQQIQIIKDTAASICNTIKEAKGKKSDFQIQGDIKAQLGGLVGKLADIGGSGRGSVTNEEFEGLSRDATAAALTGDRDCRERLFNKMFDKLSLAQPTDPARAKPLYPHMIVTPRLGLQFRQDDEIVPITREGADTEKSISHVRLKRSPFEIMMPARLSQGIDKEDVALMITISRDPAVFDLVGPNSRIGGNHLFGLYQGMADNAYGSGELLAVDYDLQHLPFNYIIGGRFNVESEGRRGIYVSSIPRIWKGLTKYDGPDLLKTAPGAYLVCRFDTLSGDRSRRRVSSDPNDILEMELIHIEFGD